jgi:dethiobiotin synthetase
MNVLFVTGTDTGVGKTFVACALAHAMRTAGLRVGVMKPVETGVDDVPEDAVRRRDAAGDTAALDDVCPYRFRAALAPATAAPLEHRAVDLDRIAALLMRRAMAADMFVVEGAGGLLCPVTDDCTWLDLIRTLNLPVLLVAANRLGMLNHCALTARVLRTEGVTARGVILSHPDAVADLSAASNSTVLPTLTGLPILASVPHCENPRDAAPVLEGLVQLLMKEIP